MSDIRIAAAARRWVEARDQERAIVRGLRRCERRPGPMDADGNCDVRNVDGQMCSRAMWLPPRPDPEDPWEPLPVDQWCASCRANLPAVVELRAIRRRMGGLTSALCRAVRSEG